MGPGPSPHANPELAGALPGTSSDPRMPNPGGVRFRVSALELSLATTTFDRLERAARVLQGKPTIGLPTLTDGVSEIALLRTCHRVELYLWSDAPVDEARVLRSLGLDESGWLARSDDAAVHHLFRVACGLESMAVGEREVRDQVRAAARHVVSRHPRPVLRTLFLRAAATAEEVAPEVPASRSIAALAASRLLEESATPFPRILIVGSGVVGRTLAELLAPAGRITILYRNRVPDDAFLRQTGSRAADWSRLQDEVAVADVVVAAAKSGGHVIEPATVAGRTRPLLLIDLGVPRNITPEVAGQPGIRLIGLEQLRPRAPSGAPVEVERKLTERSQETFDALAALGFEAAIDAYRRGAERIRRAMVDEVRRTLPPLTEEQEDHLDRLTRKLTDRLLHGPTQGLRSLPPGPAGDALRRWALEALRLDAPPS